MIKDNTAPTNQIKLLIGQHFVPDGKWEMENGKRTFFICQLSIII